MSGREEAQQEFARWLQEVRAQHGQAPVRTLEERTERQGYRVSKSTMADMLSGRRFPTLDQAVAFARAASEEHRPTVEKTMKLWREASLVLHVSPASTPGQAAPSSDAVPAEASPVVSGSEALEQAAQPGGEGAGKSAPATSPHTVNPEIKPRKHADRGKKALVGAGIGVAIATTVAGLAASGIFNGDSDTPQAHGPTRPASSSEAAAKHANAAPDPDRWTGPSPIAVQGGVQERQCPMVWFNGTTKEYLAQLQPGLAPPKSAVNLNASRRITVQGNTARSVLLMSMDLQITARRAKPASGIVVSSGQCGGGVSERYFDVDLSKTPPAFTAKPEVDDFTGRVVKPAVKFPFKIADDDPEVFSLHLKGQPAGGCGDCSYNVVLHWIAEGKNGTSTVGGDAKGFRLIDTTGLPAYYMADPRTPGGQPEFTPAQKAGSTASAN
ncbi:hypothetical protein ACLMNJ_27245 [Streptomyces seoulensis]